MLIRETPIILSLCVLLKYLFDNAKCSVLSVTSKFVIFNSIYSTMSFMIFDFTYHKQRSNKLCPQVRVFSTFFVLNDLEINHSLTRHLWQ